MNSHQLLSKKGIIVLLVFVVGSIFNFLPQILGFSARKYSDSSFGLLSSVEYSVSIIATLSTTIPILIDCLLDLGLEAFKIFSNSLLPIDNGSNIFVPFRETIFFLIIPDILILLWVIPFERHNIYLEMICARDTLFTYSLLSCIVKFSNPIWTWTSVILIGSPFMISNILISFQYLADDAAAFSAFVYVLIPVLVAIGFLFLALYIIYWIRYLIHLDDKKNKRNFLCSFYVVTLLVFLVTEWLLFFNMSTIEDALAFSCSYNYLTASCTLGLTAISSRCMRFEADETKDMLAGKQMFMRCISHEIRTPLNTAFIGLRILLDELKSLGHLTLLSTATDAHKSCQIAIDILNDILLYDKMSSGIIMLEKRILDPVDFLLKVISPFKFQAEEKGVELKLQHNISPSEPCRLRADPYKLSQVMRNLISNALKFTPRLGYVRVEIEIERDEARSGNSVMEKSSQGYFCDLWKRKSDRKVEARDSRNMIIRVTDSGAGISLENQKKLFKEIVQFNPGKLQQGQGTGLGLIITKQIVDAHGGTVFAFSSGEGEGSTFTVRLPCFVKNRESDSHVEEEEEELFDMESSFERFSASSAKQSTIAPTSKPRNSSRTLRNYDFAHEKWNEMSALVVDDSDMSRRMVCKILEATKTIACDQASDGSIAVRMVEEKIAAREDSPLNSRRYDLILMDYQMPNMDGPTAISMIRNMGFTGIILGLTGNALQDDKDVMIAAGADDVLVKPLSIDAFWEMMKHLSK